MMANDPCRRFVIAFTIEDQEMRFWYFSRLHIAIGEAFDYHQVCMSFISVATALLSLSRISRTLCILSASLSL